MSNPEPGTVGVVGIFALYGVYELITRDRIQLQKHDNGNATWLTWEDDAWHWAVPPWSYC